MKLRICTCKPLQVRKLASVPETITCELMPGADWSYIQFSEGSLFSQHITGNGFRLAYFVFELTHPLAFIPESDDQAVFIAYILQGNARGTLQHFKGPHEFKENHAYLIQHTAGAGNKIHVPPGRCCSLVLIFEGVLQKTLLHKYPRFLSDDSQGESSQKEALPYPPMPMGFKEHYHVRKLLHPEKDSDSFRVLLNGKVHTLLYRLMKQLNREDFDEVVQTVKDYILEHLHERPNMAQLSRLAGLNANALARRFKKATGKTIKQYMLHQRITRACMWIDEGKTVKEVYGQLGYHYRTHFANDVRKCCGMTLSELVARPQDYLNKGEFA